MQAMYIPLQIVNLVPLLSPQHCAHSLASLELGAGRESCFHPTLFTHLCVFDTNLDV